MFGRSRSLMFDSHDRRSRARVPSWLLLLLIGIAIGVVGVVVVQERYLPPRLSAAASAELRDRVERSEHERARLADQVQIMGKKLADAEVERAALNGEAEGARATLARLRADLASVIAALPADPRGGKVEVRAGQLTAKGGMLDYEVVLTRDGGDTKPIAGNVLLTVTGESARGVPDSVKLDPVKLPLRGHAVVRGQAPLPSGFTPRQTEIGVFDGNSGKPLGMRILRVQ